MTQIDRTALKFANRAYLVAMASSMTLLPAGCMHRHPLVAPNQAKLIQRQDKYLKQYSSAIQEKIKTAGTNAALVVTKRDTTATPIVLPADDPATATRANLESVESGEGCIFVFRGDLPLEPQPLSCKLLSAQEKQRLAIQARLDQQERIAAELQASLITLENKTSDLQESVRKEQESLRQQEVLLGAADNGIKDLAGILAPSVKLVGFHEAQLKGLESSLRILKDSNQHTTDVVGQNNKQIDKIISDLNTALTQIRQSLDQMQQKLATIK